MPALRKTRLFAAVVFLASVLVLAVQLINPSPVVVSVGENGAETAELGSYFRYRDVAVIAGSALSLGVSGTYILLAEDHTDSARSEQTDQQMTNGSGDSDGTIHLETGERQPSEDLLEARREEWEQTADRLANKEREVYETILDADGVLGQSEIVERTDLSKASVSRALDSLETKNLIERKRRGMGNMVLLR